MRSGEIQESETKCGRTLPSGGRMCYLSEIIIFVCSPLPLCSRCYNCGGPDHHAKECQLPPQPKKCHFCQSISHMVANCPIKAQQSSPGVQGTALSLRDEEEEQSHAPFPPRESYDWSIQGFSQSKGFIGVLLLELHQVVFIYRTNSKKCVLLLMW